MKAGLKYFGERSACINSAGLREKSKTAAGFAPAAVFVSILRGKE